MIVEKYVNTGFVLQLPFRQSSIEKKLEKENKKENEVHLVVCKTSSNGNRLRMRVHINKRHL